MFCKKKTCLGFCLSIALALSVTLMSYADAQHLYTGGYPASVVQSLKYVMDGGDSTYQYSIMDSGAQAWNNISTKVRVTFNTSGAKLSIHKTYIGNDGLYGEMIPYKSDYTMARTSDIWYVCDVNLYDNQMDNSGFNTYQKKATCTHEVGHSLSLAHTNDLTTLEVMDQGINKALSPTDIDKGHLKLKWVV